MLKETDVEVALANCRALINQINAGLSAEEPFVDVSSARELLFYLERPLLLSILLPKTLISRRRFASN